MNSKFLSVIKEATNQAASDAHILSNKPVALRVNGVLYPQKNSVFSWREIDAVVASLLDERQKAVLRAKQSVDFSKTVGEVHARFSVVDTSKGLSITIRFFPGRIPELDELNLHPSLNELSSLKEGLVLFCGPTGSGKSTTIASILNEINKTRAAHVVTIEDPIEFHYPPGLAFIEQRELGLHCDSYEQALYDVLRQMPDVIMLGELRQKEVIQNTVNIAESGHLVIGTLHANDVETAIFRMLNAFPAEGQMLFCSQLATVLKAIVIQRLDFHEKTDFRVPHLSILRSNRALQNTIRDAKINQIDSFLDVAGEKGMFTFERYKREYLDKLQDFTPPTALYTSSADKSVTSMVRSSLLRDRPLTSELAPHHQQAAPEPARPAAVDKPPQQPRPERDPECEEKPPVYSVDDLSDYASLVKSLRGGEDDGV